MLKTTVLSALLSANYAFHKTASESVMRTAAITLALENRNTPVRGCPYRRDVLLSDVA